MERHFPADYRVVLPGTDAPEQLSVGRRAGADTLAAAPTTRASARERNDGDPVQILFVEHEERAALRVFLRALRRLDARDAVAGHGRQRRGESSAAPLRASLRERVRFLTPQDGPRAPLLAEADVLVCASEGVLPGPRSAAARARRRRRAARLAHRRSTRSCSPRASAGCCSSRATSTRSPPSSRG